MINLCYIKTRLNIIEYKEQLNNFFSNLTSDDLVIFPKDGNSPLGLKATACEIIYDQNIDFENVD
jgi:hypothetical protein